MLRRYPGTDFVTGLRAFAALMVVMVHTAAFSDLGWAGKALSEMGRHGVIVFFVISGFSVSASFFTSRGYFEYLIRRLARIWPLYAAVITAAFILHALGLISIPYWMERFAVRFDTYNYIMHLTFLSFLDYRIAASVIGIEWTLPIEIVWYLVLPLVLARFYDWRSLFAAIVICYVLGIIVRLGFRTLLGSDGGFASGWFPVRYGVFFVLGVIAYKIRQERPALERRAACVILGASVLAALIFALFNLSSADYVLGVATFAIIAFYRTDIVSVRILLENRITLFLGTISYSIYLTHTLVMEILGMPLGLTSGATGFGAFLTVSACTIALSALTYLLIERPTNRIGKILAARVWSGKEIIADKRSTLRRRL